MFHPRIIDITKEGYSSCALRKDLLSGLTVAIVAIPLSIAFAIASGTTPVIGIFTAIIGGLIVSLFGGSKYNISGPAGAFIGVIYLTIAHYGYGGLLVSTFLAGVIIMCFATLKLGSLIKKIPNCVIIGFSLGLGIDILSGQLADFLGLQIHGGENFATKITICWHHLMQYKIHSVAIGCLTILITIITRHINKSLPAFLIAIIVSYLSVKFLGLQIDTIESRFGGIHLSLPEFHTTIISQLEHPMHIFYLLPTAFTISFLASIEALLAATIADKMTGEYHRPNTELFSLGIANCISALFGCIPIAGTTARTIVNVNSGAKSSFAGVFHGIFLIILTVLLSGFISGIGMPVIAGILIVVAIDMMSWKKIVNIIQAKDKLQIFIITTTAACVITYGIVAAIMINTLLYHSIKSTRMKDTIFTLLHNFISIKKHIIMR